MFGKFLFCMTLLGTELDLVGFFLNLRAIDSMEVGPEQEKAKGILTMMATG